MKHHVHMLVILASLAATGCVYAPDVEEAKVEQDPAAFENIFAKIVKIDGPIEEIMIDLPNAETPVPRVGMILPIGTRVITGDATVILELLSEQDSQSKTPWMIAIRHACDCVIDVPLFDVYPSVANRMKIASGVSRRKVTDDSSDYEPDIKVSDPNATHSCRMPSLVTEKTFSGTISPTSKPDEPKSTEPESTDNKK